MTSSFDAFLSAPFDAEALARAYGHEGCVGPAPGGCPGCEHLAALLRRTYDAGRRRGVEDAAGVCERLADVHEEASVRADAEQTRALQTARMLGVHNAARAIRALLDPKPDPDQGPGDPLVSEMLRGSGEMRPFDFDHEATKAWAAACKLMEANGEDPERMVREATKGLSDWQGVQTSEEMPEHFEREPRGSSTSTPPQPAEIVEADAGRAPEALALAVRDLIDCRADPMRGPVEERGLWDVVATLARWSPWVDAEGSES